MIKCLIYDSTARYLYEYLHMYYTYDVYLCLHFIDFYMLCSEGNLSSSERQPFLRGLSLSILRHRIGRRGGRAPASTLHTSRSLALRRLRPKREAAPKPTVQCPHCHSFMNLVNVDEYLRTYSPRPFSTTPSARATRPPLKPRILIPSPPPSATDNANVSDDGTIADQSSIPEEHASAQVQSPEPESSPYPVTPHVASVASLSDAHQDSGSTPPIVDDSIFAAPAVQPQKSSGVLQSLSEHQHQQKRVSRASKARCLQLLNSIAREERSVESSSESSSDEEHHSELLHRPLLDSSRAAASSTRAPQRTATTRAAPQAPASFLGAGGVSPPPPRRFTSQCRALRSPLRSQPDIAPIPCRARGDTLHCVQTPSPRALLQHLQAPLDWGHSQLVQLANSNRASKLRWMLPPLPPTMRRRCSGCSRPRAASLLSLWIWTRICVYRRVVQLDLNSLRTSWKANGNVHLCVTRRAEWTERERECVCVCEWVSECGRYSFSRGISIV